MRETATASFEFVSLSRQRRSKKIKFRSHPPGGRDRAEGEMKMKALGISRSSLRHECVRSERAAEGIGQGAGARKATGSHRLQTRWNGQGDEALGRGLRRRRWT